MGEATQRETLSRRDRDQSRRRFKAIASKRNSDAIGPAASLGKKFSRSDIKMPVLQSSVQGD